MNKIDNDTMQDLLIWLKAREQDIAEGKEDFFELRDLFYQLYGRRAGEPEEDIAVW